LHAINNVGRAAHRAKRLHQRYRRPPLTASPHALFGLKNNWNSGAGQDVRLVRLADQPVHLNLGKGGPTPNANEVAARLAVRAVANKLKTIVFVQQADHAPATAKKLVDQTEGAERLTPAEESLWSDIQAELGEGASSLVDITAGALPHNGDMIPLERRLAESLFRRADGVSLIVATPTLAQGMNLPAQIAILAGNMRHDETGRAELQQHELLNAAGRAGRAGHLANGTVLLIPEPVVGFGPNERPSAAAIAKLQSILPDSDHCVRIDDPLTELFDRIQAGERDAPKVRYLLSRLRAGEEDAATEEIAVRMVARSFAAYQARANADEAAFAKKVAAVKVALAEDGEQNDRQAMRICSGPQLRDTALLIHAAAGSGASCAALTAAGVW
jgi:ATP-dependent RNA helicase HelY